MENDPLIVDSHQHFWEVGRFDYPWMSPEVEVLYRDYLPPALASVLNRNGVDKTIVVQASNSLEETRWLLSLTKHNAFIGGVVGWVDLQSVDVARQLDEFVAHPKFKGVRHLVESEPADDWLTQQNTLNGLRELSSRGLSYDLLVHTRHLEHVRKVADECPELHLVIDHLAKPAVARREIDDWAREMREIASRPNVWCKLSGLVTEADWANWRVEDLQPYVEKALEYFGPARLMFGSDWPVCLLAASYDQVLDSSEILLAGLDEKDRRRVFSESAIEFYRLEDEEIAA